MAIQPFAEYGCEKMLYDVRMGPQAVCHDDVIYTVYQANADGPEGHPHIRMYDLNTKCWSESVQIGKAPRYDHHFAPILWFDEEDHLHVLFNCHGGNGGTHVVSEKPRGIDGWKPGPEIGPSISYPHVMRLPDGRHVIYYRTFGHMGYWTYQMSDDGGYTWTRPYPLIDFDQHPQTNRDTWAGSYQSVETCADGKSLHIAFVYWDESKARNPLYGRRLESNNRYHLYYARLDLDLGQLLTIEGDPIPVPVTRHRAEICKVWDTGHCLSNMPAILEDASGKPCFLTPVAGEESPWRGQFYFVQRQRGEWMRTPVARMNNTWDGCLLRQSDSGDLLAYMATGEYDGQILSYGGGTIEVWTAKDNGTVWEKVQELVPEPGLIYNNPRPVETSAGEVMDGFLMFYGWEGPGSIQRQTGSLLANSPYLIELAHAPEGNQGKAFLWHNGEWL